MAVVKINAISVPEGAGAELESRFSARKHAVDSSPGFLGFQLLRPVRGDDRYFVVTTWADEASFEKWRTEQAPAAHGGNQKAVSTGADLLEFEVVEL
jgi:heme-degrading monooxygenase HmoA